MDAEDEVRKQRWAKIAEIKRLEKLDREKRFKRKEKRDIFHESTSSSASSCFENYSDQSDADMHLNLHHTYADKREQNHSEVHNNGNSSATPSNSTYRDKLVQKLRNNNIHSDNHQLATDKQQRHQSISRLKQLEREQNQKRLEPKKLQKQEAPRQQYNHHYSTSAQIHNPFVPVPAPACITESITSPCAIPATPNYNYNKHPLAVPHDISSFYNAPNMPQKKQHYHQHSETYNMYNYNTEQHKQKRVRGHRKYATTTTRFMHQLTTNSISPPIQQQQLYIHSEMYDEDTDDTNEEILSDGDCTNYSYQRHAPILSSKPLTRKSMQSALPHDSIISHPTVPSPMSAPTRYNYDQHNTTRNDNTFMAINPLSFYTNTLSPANDNTFLYPSVPNGSSSVLTDESSFSTSADVSLAASCPAPDTGHFRVRSNCKIDRYGFPMRERSTDPDHNERKTQLRKEKVLLLQWQNIVFPTAPKKSDIDWSNLKNKSSDNNKIRTLINNSGVPQPLRSFVWSNLCNVDDIKKRPQNIGLYESLLAKNEANIYDDIIWKDIHRTFSDNMRYGAKSKTNNKRKRKTTESQESLYNVLCAFSNHNKDIGYCQGMQAISALLLMYMIEEDVFFILSTIARSDKYGALCSCWNMEQILLRFAQFKYCFKEYLPRLYKHFTKHGITEVSMFGTTAWFITIFISSPLIEFDLIVRIWDIYLSKGFKAVFQFGVGYLKYLEKKLLKTDTFEELLTILNTGFKSISGNRRIHKYIQTSLSIKIKRKQIDKWAQKYNKSNSQ